MRRFFKNLWRKITRRRVRDTRPSYRESSGSNKPKLMHPLAIFKEDLSKLYAPYKFKFEGGYYFIVHYTSGRFERKARDFFNRFKEMGLCTYFIDGEGQLWQQHDGDKCGHHVGSSKWFGKSISKKCAGVEIACAGKVKPIGGGFYESWFGQKFSGSEVREITRAQVDAGEYEATGFFVKYKPQQEKTLAHLLAYQVALGLPKDNILGHDSVAWKRGRKVDHGGSLSKPLKLFIEEDVMPLVAQYKTGEL